jgi:hypothetical protein
MAVTCFGVRLGAFREPSICSSVPSARVVGRRSSLVACMRAVRLVLGNWLCLRSVRLDLDALRCEKLLQHSGLYGSIDLCMARACTMSYAVGIRRVASFLQGGSCTVSAYLPTRSLLVRACGTRTPRPSLSGCCSVRCVAKSSSIPAYMVP